MEESLNYDILREDEEKRNDIQDSNTRLTKKCSNAIFGITVEPLGVIIRFVISMYYLISNQYIYEYIAKANGLNITEHSTSCGDTDTSSLEAKVSAESSQWILYLNIAGFVPTLFTTVIIGTWGDTVGRRLPLLIGYYGFLFMIITYLIVIIFELHVGYLLIARIVCGLAGDLAVVYCCIFAYLADISNKENRTFKIAVGEAALGIGGALGSLLNGIWVDKQGFIPPIIFMVAILVAGIVYITFFLSESKPVKQISLAQKFKSMFTLKPYIGLKNTMFGGISNSLKVWGGVICFFIQSCVLYGFGDISALFQLSPPLCFSSLFLGYASAIYSIAAFVGMIFIKILPFNDYFLVILGMLSNVTIFLFHAYSTKQWMIFLGLAFGMLNTLTLTVLRSIISKLVSVNTQGSVFAVVATTQAMSGLIGSFIFNSIYSATVAWFSGFVFFALIIFEMVLYLLFSFVYLNVKNDLVDNNLHVTSNTMTTLSI